jgi:hypothetical protein
MLSERVLRALPTWMRITIAPILVVARNRAHQGHLSFECCSDDDSIPLPTAHFPLVAQSPPTISSPPSQKHLLLDPCLIHLFLLSNLSHIASDVCVAPHARPHDGIAHLILHAPASRFRSVWRFARIGAAKAKAGSGGDDDILRSSCRALELRVNDGANSPIVIDGEWLQGQHHVRVVVRPATARVYAAKK